MDRHLVARNQKKKEGGGATHCLFFLSRVYFTDLPPDAARHFFLRGHLASNGS